MHESSLIPDLIRQLEQYARENAARRVVAIDVTIGALTGMDVDHLREHFVEHAAGTVAEGAAVRGSISDDPMSSAVILDSVEMEK